MAKKVEVPPHNLHHLIRQAYDSCGKYQWAREAMVNSIEAKAKWIRFGIDEQGLRLTGTARRYIADNGMGMNEAELVEFLSTFSGGGKDIGYSKNFGQGFKSSCYQWNPYGIIILSWTEDTPEGRGIWIHFNEAGSTWELHDFDVISQDEDGNQDTSTESWFVVEGSEDFDHHGLRLDMTQFKFSEIDEKGSGTVFLFLGDSPTRDTVHGDYLRNEDSKRKIVEYLNTRFLTVPEGIDISVSSLESKAEKSNRRETKDNFVTTPDGTRYTIHSRKVRGMKDFISEGSISGVVEVSKNTQITWYYSDPETTKSKDRTSGPKKSAIVLDYEGEAYNVMSAVQDYRKFGLGDIREDVWLFIEPPVATEETTEWGVFPQASRGWLIPNDSSTSLPIEKWGDEFWDDVPKVLSDALAKAREGKGDSGDSQDRMDRLKRTAERLSSRFKPTVLVENKDGDTPGDPASGVTGKPDTDTGKDASEKSDDSSDSKDSSETGMKGDQKILNQNEDGKSKGVLKRRGNGIPAIQWEHFTEESDVMYAARYDDKVGTDGSSGTIYINTAFPVFVNEFNYWAETYNKASSDSVNAAVKQVYEDELASKVLHAHKMIGTVYAHEEDGSVKKYSRADILKWVDPAALTSAVLGLVNVEYRVVSLLSKYGKRKS